MRSVAYYNQNMTGAAGVGKDFSWYSEGGTLHAETGNPAYVGQEIERASGQTANLWQLLGSDGVTVLSEFDKNGYLGIGTTSPATSLQVAGTAPTVRIGASSLAGCIEIGNSDGSAGINYVTFLSGVMSATTTKPSMCQ